MLPNQLNCNLQTNQHVSILWITLVAICLSSTNMGSRFCQLWYFLRTTYHLVQSWTHIDWAPGLSTSWTSNSFVCHMVWTLKWTGQLSSMPPVFRAGVQTNTLSPTKYSQSVAACFVAHIYYNCHTATSAASGPWLQFSALDTRQNSLPEPLWTCHWEKKEGISMCEYMYRVLQCPAVQPDLPFPCMYITSQNQVSSPSMASSVSWRSAVASMSTRRIKTYTTAVKLLFPNCKRRTHTLLWEILETLYRR